MNHPASIRIEDYNYELPEDRIAKFPLAVRDESKLLYFEEGGFKHKSFKDLPSLLPEKAILVFNETKVIRARLLFKKSTGAVIEVFCLEPVEPVNDFQLAFQQTKSVVWKCLVGNAKRWKDEDITRIMDVNGESVVLKASKVERLSDGFLVRLSWDPPHISFSEIIENTGVIPLPPYLNREAEEDDSIRYQTVYACHDGSVAAPTAGLHFTAPLLEELRKQGIDSVKLSLHVGAGTFKPVSTETIADHEMHTEKIVLSLDALIHLQNRIQSPIIAVGTTSMRSLESLFWLALKIKNADHSLVVSQWDPYEHKVANNFDAHQALEVLIHYLKSVQLDYLKAETRLMVAPGYQFRIATGMITNFHQPKSTLLLLVSAMIGENWKTAYEYAKNNDFRFLSYGDSCLFLPQKMA